MPVRIYALAKELKVDSKELVELCSKAGITGKGSALASLTDDEATKLRAHVSGGGGTSTATAVPGNSSRSNVKTPIKRDDYVAPGGAKATSSKPKVIQVKPKVAAPVSTSDEASELVAEAEPTTLTDEPTESPEVSADEMADVEVTPVAESPVAEDEVDVEEMPVEASEDEVEPETPVDPDAPRRVANAITRPEPVMKQRIQNLQNRGGGKKKDDGKAKQKQPPKPVVRVAAIPKQKEPSAKPKSKEPAPQKPIMTLPADAIRNAKSGKSAPLEQFTKQTDRNRSDGAGTGTGRPAKPTDGAQPAAGDRAGVRRRGKGGGAPTAADDEDKKLATLSNARVARQQKRRRNLTAERDDDDGRRRRRRLTRKGTNTAAPRKGRVVVELPCTVRTLSEATGVPTVAIQRTLMQMGAMVTINAGIDEETAEHLAVELDMDVDFKPAETLEDKLITELDELEDDPDSLVTRPPVITFLGHVDHGKTSLLDALIGIDVVSGEAGGITQHIRAYKIKKDGREIAFVDTPGHEAFTEMRARGANVTDIAVLVVAADDGVMPQTEEAISHARAAGVPIVIALNKIDLPGADENKVFQGLAQHDLLPTEWGGDVEVVRTSAIKGTGLDDLLETLLLTADIHEYTANPNRAAMGTCLEAEQEGNRGVVAKVIVKNGTLRVGDVIVCGAAHGRVKAMYDTLKPRKKLLEAGPSTPVNLTGLDIAPGAGDAFHTLDDIAAAREIAENRHDEKRSQSLSGKTVRVSFEEFQRRMEDGNLGGSHDVTILNIILRADVRGSIEALQKELQKLDHPEVKVNLLQASVGGVTSADVTLADASDAVIVGFNVIPDEAARSLADERGVEIRRYDIIYKVSEDIRALLEGKLRPEERVKELGRALVQRTFTISRLGTIAGCRVLAGTVERNCKIRVNRDGRGIGEYPLDSLKREKDDAKEVREGFECGIKLSGFNDLKEGDILEAYKIEEIARTL